MAKFTDHMEKIAGGVAEGFQKIEDGVITGYTQIEGGVVGGYKKIENAFVGTFMAKEGESVQDAKARMTAQREQIEKSLEASRNAGKRN